LPASARVGRFFFLRFCPTWRQVGAKQQTPLQTQPEKTQRVYAFTKESRNIDKRAAARKNGPTAGPFGLWEGGVWLDGAFGKRRFYWDCGAILDQKLAQQGCAFIQTLHKRMP
jgi:hypothetical protein